VGCGDLDKDESRRPKCNSKTQYVHTEVSDDGKAEQSCRATRKFYDRKKSKPTNSSLRAKIKDQWNKLKPDYDKKNKERQENLKKLKAMEEENEKRQKEMAKENKKLEANDKKKERQSKCSTAISLLLGVAFSGASAKRDGDGEHPYDWTTDYFDEEFVGSDDRLKDWPPDLDVEKISADVDTQAFLKQWDEAIDDKKRIGHSCTYVKRSLDPRCSQRRSLEGLYDDSDLDTQFSNSSSLLQRHMDPIYDSRITSNGIQELEKRNPLAALLSLLGIFGSRLATQVIARATASVAAQAPRLANLIQNPGRLFQIASKGKGAKGGQPAMQSAKQAIMKDNKRWLKCLKDGIP